MNMRQLGLTVAVAAGLVIAFLVGQNLKVAKTNPTDRLVTISVSPTSPTVCEVDYPVAALRPNANKMQWASAYNQYWISFVTLGETVSGYTPESPLVSGPANGIVAVAANNSSPKFNVKADPSHGDPSKPDYYMYAIYDHDPATNPNNPCKKASDDRDTGVIIKR